MAPFLWVALFWCVLGVVVLSFTQAQIQTALFWALGLWLFCLFDLVALAKTIAAAMNLMSDQVQEKTIASIQTLFWGTIKLCSFGVLGWILFQAKAAPIGALVMGVGTMLVVPLVGGFWWSKKELNHA